MGKRKQKATLKSIRIASGLTQLDVERITEGTHYFIPQPTLSSWETGLNVPSINTMIFLSGLYKCSVQELSDAWQNTEKEYIEKKKLEKKKNNPRSKKRTVQ